MEVLFHFIGFDEGEIFEDLIAMKYSSDFIEFFMNFVGLSMFGYIRSAL